MEFAYGDGKIIAEDIERAERGLLDKSAELFASDEFVPLEYLLQSADCDRLERHCVIMALARELDGDFARELAAAHGDSEMAFLSPQLLRRTWHIKTGREELFAKLDASSLMSRMFFFNVMDTREPWELSPVLLSRRALAFILGQLEPEAELGAMLEIGGVEQEMPTPASTQPKLSAVMSAGKNLISLFGAEGVGKRFTARCAAAERGEPVCSIRMGAVCSHGFTHELASEILRECLIFGAVPVLEIPPEGAQWESATALAALLFECCNLVITVSESRMPDAVGLSGISHKTLEVRDLTLTEKREVWRRESAAYAFESGVCPEEMANVFNLTYGKARRALELAQQCADRRGEVKISEESLRLGCREMFEQNGTGKAVRVSPIFTWDDLILPSVQKEALLRACNQVRNKHLVYEGWGFEHKMPYGRGVGMIFTGSPGTGKTMAAQIFARELGIDLYKVELSAVVSKFVGETEKNLDEIFSRAEHSRVALFFDEADVLFSKRTEIKDSNDKYSNMEAAFLLQKMESYEGVTILATNLIQNFDEAFKRRVKFIIDFPFPDRLQRLELWHKAFPAQMPLGDLDFDFLAEKFELSGSNIRNIALFAAFLAAEHGGAVSMAETLQGIQNEYAKSGKTLTRVDVGEYYVLLPESR